ncbi:hypothetical protein BDN72DRAFT_863251 [Pluteus cervinus]|uniref:Uncharacterized protein n=1 Tax=Pluteus cervinus TaxID=181527 RepID=A0ACD3A919_9AGAR|nr:hypothetical protein BDN72DRAFT_863251 [Pluteus cervinus]
MGRGRVTSRKKPTGKVEQRARSESEEESDRDRGHSPVNSAGEEDEESSEDESDSPESGDLRDDLHQALGEFKFGGRFASRKKFSAAPDPHLEIEGVGSITLPLSERDAKRIAAFVEPPPPRGKKKAKKETRSEWEVDASKVSLEESSWKTYLDKKVLLFLWEDLGIEVLCQFRLSKLLLQGTGSDDLSIGDADDQQPKGMFATVVILLPSAHTGGEILFSHPEWAETKFDISKSSTSTNALAWYPGVEHSSDPLTSGYRLALVYHAIHIPREGPKPSLPDTETCTRNLQRVLRKWNRNKYPPIMEDQDEEDQDDMLVYILDDYRADRKLEHGITCLTNQDAYKVMNTQSVAEENGFVALLGNIELVVTGFPEDTHYRDYHRSRKRNRHRCDYSFLCGGGDDVSDDGGAGHDADDMEMEEENERSLQVKVMVEVGGGSLGAIELEIEEDHIVQKNPFNNVAPDERKFDGDRRVRCAGNQLEFRYHRTALILLKEEKADEFLFDCYGLSYVFRELNNTEDSESSADIRKLASMAAKRLDPQSESEEDIESFAKIALDWEDLPMLADICKREYDIGIVGFANYTEGIKVFSFASMRPILEACLAHVNTREGLKLVRSISELSLPTKGGGAWCRDKLKALGASK